MAASADPVISVELPHMQSSKPGPNHNNTSLDDGLGDKRNENITLNTIFIMIAAIGVPLNGLTAVEILNDVLPLHAAKISSVQIFLIEIGDWWPFLVVTSSMLGIIGFRRMWLIGSSILCPLIFPCGFVCTDSQIHVFRIILEVILAMMRATSMGFVGLFMRSAGPLRYALLFSSLAIGPVYARILGSKLSHIFSKEWGFCIIVTIHVVLFLLSTIALPPDPESHRTTGTFWVFTRGAKVNWSKVMIVIAFVGDLSYIIFA